MLTVRLNKHGHFKVVLAKLQDGVPHAIGYANRTQAARAAEKIGGTVHGWYPFYVVPPTTPEEV
jgi:hypothetical protein